MAEERLIDTDKDKKYRIRRNADGEDELYIDESAEEEETEEVTFMVEGESGRNCVDSVEMDSQGEEEKRLLSQEAEELIQNARKDCQGGAYATAADYLEKAVELAPENGEIYGLELVIYTRNFTDYSKIKDAVGYVEELKKYTSAQTKQQLFEMAHAGLEENIDSLKTTVDTLCEENEKQKAIRAKKFLADRSRMAVLMSIAIAVFGALFGGSIYCYSNINSAQTNVFLIVGIVLSAFAFAAFVVSGIVLSRLLTACRRVRLNKKNTATELGRKMLAYMADLDAFTAIYEALKG